MIDKDIAYADALELLAEVAACGVEHSAPGYVTVQIDKDAWAEIQQFHRRWTLTPPDSSVSDGVGLDLEWVERVLMPKFVTAALSEIWEALSDTEGSYPALSALGDALERLIREQKKRG